MEKRTRRRLPLPLVSACFYLACREISSPCFTEERDEEATNGELCEEASDKSERQKCVNRDGKTDTGDQRRCRTTRVPSLGFRRGETEASVEIREGKGKCAASPRHEENGKKDNKGRRNPENPARKKRRTQDTEREADGVGFATARKDAERRTF